MFKVWGRGVALVVILLAFSFGGMKAQRLALKSNLLFDATTTLNIGAEGVCKDKYTIEASLSYNPWTFSDNRKMKLLLFQPGFRWWKYTPFDGLFWGAQAHVGQFNFGGMLPWGFSDGKMLGINNDNIQNSRFQGFLYGVGGTVGYQWMLGTHWNLEASVACGWAQLSYDRYGREVGAAKIDHGHQTYIGVTGLSVSILYFLK